MLIAFVVHIVLCLNLRASECLSVIFIAMSSFILCSGIYFIHFKPYNIKMNITRNILVDFSAISPTCKIFLICSNSHKNVLQLKVFAIYFGQNCYFLNSRVGKYISCIIICLYSIDETPKGFLIL